ncbi:MAG: TetR family transcriptional regulator [Cytophagaceae bacterium]|nr:TetR family transcriptional regulator [Cytophagaceae bacterium]
MRPLKSENNEVLLGLSNVFRSKGYDGASLQELASATGLKKASLYHRFPNGKQEMAEAVFDYLGDWVQKNIFEILANPKDTPQLRLKQSLEQIKLLYGGGHKPCVFNVFSLETGNKLFANQITSGLQQWITVFEQLGVAFDFPQEIATQYAHQTLIDIQGSLILATGLNDADIFIKTLKNIEERYIK